MNIYRKSDCGQPGYCCPPPVCCCPPGPTGPTGPAGLGETITVRDTITGDPGSPAQVRDVTGGPNHVLDFVIPSGEAGQDGQMGPTGPAGPQGTAGAPGPTGPTGPTGPAGSPANSASCACMEQMRNILQQLMTFYPNNTMLITLESGDAVVGRPGSVRLGPNGRTGVFEVITAQNLSQFLPICSIDSILINNAVYNDAIVYLPQAVPAPTDCCADCEAVIRSLLPVGADVSIVTNTQTASSGTVIRNEPGMLVLADEENSSLSFVSICKIDLFYS